MNKDLFGNESKIDLPRDAVRTKTGRMKFNPCIDVYGKGTDGKKCRECALLLHIQGGAKYYYKCPLRKINHSPTTDHNSRFPACGKFEPK